MTRILNLSRPARITVFVVFCGLCQAPLVFLPFFVSGPHLNVVLATAAAVTTVLLVYGLSRIVVLVNDHAAVTSQAVSAERMHFERDLHDLLGYSLSAIKVKSELSHQLVVDQPSRARQELAEILEIVQHAVAELRSVAHGRVRLSLADESRSARSVLTAAGITAQIEVDHQPLPEHIATVLATVLREGVTNILRHSKAEQCRIAVWQSENLVHMDIVNDHAAPPPVDEQGSGLRNLTERVRRLGGCLTAHHVADDQFRLRVTVSCL